MQKEYIERIDKPQMTFYRETYKNSKRWVGGTVKGKTVIIYCEQGLGDTIQFARYFGIPDANVILHCDVALHKLFTAKNWQVIDKNNPSLPPHDYHVLSMSLPWVLGTDPFQTKNAYIQVPPAKLDIADKDVEKIGICWEGNPLHSNNLERCCPLKHFKSLVKPNRKLFMLQKEIQTQDLIKDCEDLDLYSVKIDNMYDLAQLITTMDIVVSVDTAALHLSGAIGKKTFGLLSKRHDHRWKVSTWYPSLTLLTQDKEADWSNVFEKLSMLLDTH